MLLGCCHCGSESLPPSESNPSESMPPSDSASDSASDILTPSHCANCSALPRRWSVPVPTSGWTFNAKTGFDARQDCGITNVFGTTIAHYVSESARPDLYDDYTEKTCGAWISNEQPTGTAKYIGTTLDPNVCTGKTFSPQKYRVVVQLHQYGSIANDQGLFVIRHQYVSINSFGLSGGLISGITWEKVISVNDLDRNCVKAFDVGVGTLFGSIPNDTYTRSGALPSMTISPG